ncbi:PREDICTED: odorant receptor 4-like [Trachymyrmex cornetzi]|uniref:odorant receptor 4-like n=1 Tax=Trachymyrmex cornetzi TaxID=471704 RepID=UPI00084F0B72|nr:PREDICTED: odorant receptor 4-like [Trachymyrmex cornetzi]
MRHTTLHGKQLLLTWVFGICGLFILIIAQIWSFIAHVNTVNTSQSHHLIIMTEYIVDQEKYFYWILFHMYTVLCIGPIIMMGTGTMLIIYIEHICGIFKIASYRIKHAVNNNIPRNIATKNKILMIEGIICAVDIHRQAMKMMNHFMTTFKIMISCFTGCVVVCFTCNLYQIASSENNRTNVSEFLFSFVFASVCIIYMFLANYFGQKIIDHNNHVFVTAYNGQWYKTPLHIQRMILFLLQRGAKEFSLNIGGVFDASIQGFATLIKASISYFTVMHSTQ